MSTESRMYDHVFSSLLDGLRRLTKKPWLADPSLSAAIQKVISGKTSITKLIAYSENFRVMFNERARANTESKIDCRRLKDLNHAKHRFQSTQKPLGRFVLTFDALIATAVEISVRRKNDPRKRAMDFLEGVTEEDYLTIAMLADAGDESATIVRFFDQEDYDVAAAPEVISMYLHRIDHLFTKRHCLSLVGTYTEYAIQELHRPRAITLHTKKHNAELRWQSTSTRDDRSMSIKNDGLGSLGLAKHICRVPVMGDPQCFRRLQPQAHKPIIVCQRVSAAHISCLPRLWCFA